MLLLLDGASARVLVEGGAEPVLVARRMAQNLLDRAGLRNRQ
ncbi:hypothetical protein [Streptomyces sp. BH104]